jgi:hypothetical protein
MMESFSIDPETFEAVDATMQESYGLPFAEVAKKDGVFAMYALQRAVVNAIADRCHAVVDARLDSKVTRQDDGDMAFEGSLAEALSLIALDGNHNISVNVTYPRSLFDKILHRPEITETVAVIRT